MELLAYTTSGSSYSDAAFPDGSGVDCGKLDQLQADFWSKHTDAQMTALKAYQAQQESAYPALAMYREVMDNHRANQRHWARQLGMNYTTLTQMLRDYGALAGDRRAQAQFPGATPAANDIAAPEQRVGGNSAYGRYYSLLFHTSAMRKGLAAAGETEAQGAHALEAMYHPAAPP